MNEIKTLGQLKDAGYVSKSVKQEIRDNLITKLRKNEEIFNGLIGYDNTVIPDMERALLARHNILLLGLRGQAKTRIARQMTDLLDEYIPVIAGSEINDDPLRPISRYGKDLIAEKEDDTPIDWLHRSERFVEKLATPDVTVADLIGDIDPIKAATLKLDYSDERVIHYGLLPRAHRSIFVINELPDLQPRIQVGLFNILQEGDVQIRGFNLRLPLDVQFVFTANPEDYTNRGNIVTPLKDRIGSQILTHYPKDINTAKTITGEEAKLEDIQTENVYVPELAKDILEQISFEARESEYVDEKSGVSARMSISAFQNLISTAERRLLISGDKKTKIRFSDFMGIVPAITGKIELLYEGEQEGPAFVAQTLIEEAVKSLFPSYFPKIEKLEKKDAESPYDELIDWFLHTENVVLYEDMNEKRYQETLDSITPLKKLVEKHVPDLQESDRYFMMEFVLWGLVAFHKLSKQRFDEGLQFEDLFSNYINKF